MKNAFLLFILFLITTSFEAQSKNMALVIGGVHPQSPNPFTNDIKALSSSLSAKNWQSVALVGRASSNTNITDSLGMFAILCSKEDQFLILFQGHGVEPSKERPSISHYISAEFKSLFNLDTIVPYLKKMNARGCKTALVDLSCYSGATQDLKNELPNTCIGTLASRNYVSVCADPTGATSFMKSFTQAIRQDSPNLEQAFVSARFDDKHSVNLPELSSMTTLTHSGWDQFLKETDPSGVHRNQVTLTSNKWSEAKSAEHLRAVEASATFATDMIIMQMTQMIDPLPADQKAHFRSTIESLDREFSVYKGIYNSLETQKQALLKAFLKKSVRTALEQAQFLQLETQLSQQSVLLMGLERDFYQTYYQMNPPALNSCSLFQM